MKTPEELQAGIDALKKVRAHPFTVGKIKHRIEASITALEWVQADNNDLQEIAKKITG